MKALDGSLVHVETRDPRGGEDVVLDVLVTVEIVKERILPLISKVRGTEEVQEVKVVGCKRATVKVLY